MQEYNYCYHVEPTCVSVPNGLVVPCRHPRGGGVFTADGEIVESSLDYNDCRGGMPQYDNENAVQINEDVVYVGHIASHWGFIIVESFSRLWYVLDVKKPKKIAFITNDDSSMLLGNYTKKIMEFFSYLGISEQSFVKVTNPTSFKSIVVPQCSFFHLEIPTYGKKTANAYLDRIGTTYRERPAFYYTENYRTIFQHIRNKCNLSLPVEEKIYFSRRKLKRRKEIGERSIERIFKANGYKIMYPEQLSLSEQIWYVKNCKSLASLEGTLAHNILFASENCKQIIIRKQSEFIPRQSMINQAMGVELNYIESYHEPFAHFPMSHSAGPFLLKPSKELKSFCIQNGLAFKNASWIERAIYFIEYCCKCLFVLMKMKIKATFRGL